MRRESFYLLKLSCDGVKVELEITTTTVTATRTGDWVAIPHNGGHVWILLFLGLKKSRIYLLSFSPVQHCQQAIGQDQRLEDIDSNMGLKRGDVRLQNGQQSGLLQETTNSKEQRLGRNSWTQGHREAKTNGGGWVGRDK